MRTASQFEQMRRSLLFIISYFFLEGFIATMVFILTIPNPASDSIITKPFW